MPVARTDDENWASDPELGIERETPQKRRDPTNGHTPTPASPAVSGTAAGSEGNDATAQGPPSRARERHSAEPIMLQKTGWLMLRSTSHNLNNVLHHAGVTGLRVRQMYTHEVEAEWGQVRCLISLYKWAPDRGDDMKWNPEETSSSFAVPGSIIDNSEGVQKIPEDIMFCCQVMDNASATQALLMAVMNIPEDTDSKAPVPFKLGEDLTKLKTYLRPLDPTLRGAAISSSQVVRDAHNQAAREQPGGHPDLLDEDGRLHNISLADELWMYSVFVPGKQERWVYELHGVAERPKSAMYVDSFVTESWTAVAFEELERKVESFQEHNTPFLLFAVTSGSKPEALPPVPRKIKKVESAPESEADSDTVEESSDEGKEGSSSGNVNSSGRDHSEIDEETVREEVERIRATHNYDTFFIEMMKLMASRGDLNSLIRNFPEFHDATSDEQEDEYNGKPRSGGEPTMDMR